MSVEDAERRRQRRRFIADHHPDRGGDPDLFRIGLACFDGPCPPFLPGAARTRVSVTRDPPWPRSLITLFLRRAARRRRPPRVR